MRTGPVNLTAAAASPEFFVIDLGKRLEFLDYITFGDFFEWRIAAETARKRSDRVEKVKTANDLDCLLIGMLRARTVTMSNDRMHQESPILREQCAIFALHDAE